MSEILDQIDQCIERLRHVDWKERDAIKDEILALARRDQGRASETHLEAALKTLPLELRWEIEEVLEALKPPPTPEPEPEAEAAENDAESPDDGRLRMSDLKVVYEDPRGLVLLTDKKGVKWYAQQPDPYTGQPYLSEIPAAQVPAIKDQLKGSPYWRLGSGLIT